MSAPERGRAEARFQAARIDELRARARWYATLNEVQDRTSAAKLTAKAIEELREVGGELVGRARRKIRERPMAVAAILGGVLVFALRKPLFRGARALFSRRRATRGPDREFEPQAHDEVDALPGLAPAPTMTEEI